MGSQLLQKNRIYDNNLNVILSSVKCVETERTGIVNAFGKALAEDVRDGEVLIPSGTVIGPMEMGILAIIAHPGISVYRKLRVALITTGSDVIDIMEHAQPGKTRNINRYSLVGSIFASDCDLGRLIHAHEDAESVRRGIENARRSDVIVIAGCTCESDNDYLTDILREIGQIRFSAADNEFAFALVSGKPVFVLPGNPLDAIACFELYVRPSILTMAGRAKVKHPTATAILTERLELPFISDQMAFGKSVLEGNRLVVTPCKISERGLMHCINGSNCLILLDDDVRAVDAGDEVDVIITEPDSL